MNLVEYTKLPGVSDLPTQVKARFAQALKAEDEGDTVKAEAKLAEALEAEAQSRAA